MSLTPAQLDRACGAVLGCAVGDALGAHYETGLAVGPGGPGMLGGGIGDFAPGEWTDDTAMTWAILDVAATGADLRSPQALTAIARRFRAWYDSDPPDIGAQTRAVLRRAGPHPTGASLAAASGDLHRRTGHTAGNGSLMRTAPVALAFLHDPGPLPDAAATVSALTHFDPRAGQACALWSLAIRRAIMRGEFDVRAGLARLDADGASYWAQRLDEAEGREPGRFRPNGWVVTALQAAWSAIVHTPVPGGAGDGDPGGAGPATRHVTDALAAAIRIGDDTDTVAAIAGALLGARWGAAAIPGEWRRAVHGYPGLAGEDLVDLARQAARAHDVSA